MATNLTPRRWRFRRRSEDSLALEPKGPPKSLQAGGTLEEGAIYIERPADEQIVSRLRAGDFCHVLAPRQVGKSSLRDRAARKLAAEGILCAQLDLSGTGGDLDEEVEDIERQQDDWLYSRARQILDDLAPKLPGGALRSVDMDAAWDAHAAMEPHLRFRLFLHDTILGPVVAADKRVVVFIDEIDVLLSYRWRDNFFSTIRAIKNERARAPAYQAVTFCLVGLAHPNELMRKPEHTPFNISEAVELTDFVEDDQGPFVRALRTAGLRDASDLVAEVFMWTRGHPYMTQKLCKALVESQGQSGDAESRVAALARAIFLTRGREVEAVIQYAERYLLADKLTARSMDMLMEYGRIVDGDTAPIADTGLNAAQLHLRFSGIVADVLEEGSRVLVQRNRVFAEAFDLQWLKSHLKDAEIALRALNFEKASADEKPNLMLMEEELEKLGLGLAAYQLDAPAMSEGVPASKKTAPRRDPTLSPAVVRLLTASLEMARQKAREAEAEAAKREQEARAKAEAERLRAEEATRRRYITRIGLVSLFVISVVLGGVTTYAFQERERAQNAEIEAKEQRDRATQRSLAESASAASKDGRELDALVWALNGAVFKDHEKEGIPAFAADSLAEALTAARRSYPLESTPQSEYSMFSGDGTRGLTVAGKQALLWDLATRRAIARLSAPKTLLAPPVLSPDGRTAIALARRTETRAGATLPSATPDCTAQRWSIALTPDGGRGDHGLPTIDPRESLSPLTRAASSTAAVYSDDQSRIALFEPSERADVGAWTVFDTASGEPLFTTPGPALQAATFYLQGQRFAYIDASSTVRARSLEKGVDVPVKDPTLPADEPAPELTRPSTPEKKRPPERALLTASPDGSLLLAARGFEMRIWDADGMTEVRRATVLGSVARARFYQDALFTMTDRGFFQSWTRKAESSGLLARLGRTNDVAFFEPRHRALFLTDGVARVGSVEAGDLDGRPLMGGRRVTTGGFTANGQPITAEVSGTLRVWDLPVERLVGHTGEVTSISASPDCASPDCSLLATTSRDRTARTWTTSGELKHIFPDPALYPRLSSLPRPTAAAISPTGDDLVVGYADGSIRFWDTTSGFLLRESVAPPRITGQPRAVIELLSRVASVDISGDGSLAVIADQGGSMTLLTTSGEPARAYQHWPSDGPMIFDPEARFSPDGRRVMLSGRNLILLWNLEREAAPIPLYGYSDDLVKAAFSPDGTAVMTVTVANKISTLDIRTCEGKPGCDPAKVRVGGASRVHDAAFSPDGRFIATSLDSGAVELWDLTRDAPPLVVRAPGMGGAGARSLQMLFSPDSRRLASITELGTRLFHLRIDPTTDTLIGALAITYPSDGASPSQLLFTPDGQRLATTFDDEAGTARLDPAGERGLVQLACRLLDGQFELHTNTPDPGAPPATDDAVARATPADWARARTICSDWASKLPD